MLALAIVFSCLVFCALVGGVAMSAGIYVDRLINGDDK